MSRIYLSPPHLTELELEFVTDAISSNWVAPLGPHVDAFEREVAEVADVQHAAALSAGTAAIHLALRLIGVGPGDEVVCPTLTFIASATPILYQGAEPVFVDADPDTWTIDPTLLEQELKQCARRNKLPKAVITVDLYGQSADHDAILAMCGEYDIPVIEDAAEALGSTYKGRPTGGFGRFGVFSFNGNKIITSSGGGMLVSDDGRAIERARFLATQARDPAPHYEHSTFGYNYRMSNIVAAVGRAQLATLDDRVAARRTNFVRYQELLRDAEAIGFMPEASYGQSNRWLTCIVLDPERTSSAPDDLRLALEADDVEARPIWKPMHLQPLFSSSRSVVNGVSERLFARGLCLPSGSDLTAADASRVASTILDTIDQAT